MLSFWWQLASLSIIILYTVLVFKNVNPLVATSIGVGLGFVFNYSTPIDIGIILQNSLGSFLALVGFIIMLGRGLAEILNETKVSHTIVYKIVYSIGINTQTKVKIGTVISSVVIVAILGTLAGGLSIIAPLLRPIAADVKLSRPSLAVLMQAGGEEALILGPFTPPVIAILDVSGLSYSHLLLFVALPISLVTIVTTWINANKLQKKYANELFDNHNLEQFTPNTNQKITTICFLICITLCVIYGIISHAKTSYVIFVMIFLGLATGLIAKLSLTKIFELLISGMQKNLYLFIIFVLLDPFLSLIEKAGGFHALTQILTPLANIGKPMLSILTGLTGAFGMPAAAVAVIKMLYNTFFTTALNMQLSMTTFAFSILLATRITNFAYPGANMFACMGFAESNNTKAMISNGLRVTTIQILFLVIYSLLFS